jgi:oligopeptide transport system substrate-binding protein
VPFFLDLLAFPPFYPRHEKSMEPFKQPQDNGRFTYNTHYTRPPHVVTNGPFNLTDWEFKRRLRMEKNPYYWDKANVVSDSIEMVVNEQEISQFLQYETEAVDWWSSVPAEQAAELKEKGRDKVDLHIVPAFGTEYLTVNCAEEVPGVLQGRNPMSDLRVRQALCMAIDKKALVERVTRMGERPATNYVPPGTIPDYEQTKPGLPFDVPRARRLLAEAGFPDGRGFPSISLLYNTNSPTRRDYSQFIKSQWKQNLNIDVDLHSQELTAYSAAVREEKYVIATAGWYGDYTDPSTFTDKYRRDGGNNNSNWGPQRHEDLLDAAERELDPVKRYDILEAAEAIINEDLPVIPLYHLVNMTMYRDDVVGIYDNPKLLTMFKVVGKKKPD